MMIQRYSSCWDYFRFCGFVKRLSAMTIRRRLCRSFWQHCCLLLLSIILGVFNTHGRTRQSLLSSSSWWRDSLLRTSFSFKRLFLIIMMIQRYSSCWDYFRFCGFVKRYSPLCGIITLLSALPMMARISSSFLCYWPRKFFLAWRHWFSFHSFFRRFLCGTASTTSYPLCGNRRSWWWTTHNIRMFVLIFLRHFLSSMPSNPSIHRTRWLRYTIFWLFMINLFLCSMSGTHSSCTFQQSSSQRFGLWD